MRSRLVGRSGLRVSEVAFGNWLTHGSQVDLDTARACVHAALDAGITSFDTADVYAEGRAELVLGHALAGQPRERVQIFTKVFFPTGPGPNDRGLGRKHILRSVDNSLRRLRVDHVDLYQAHRFDHSTPLEETMQAFADVVRSGKARYIGVSEWTAAQIRAGHSLADALGTRLVSNQPEYSALWRVVESEVMPACRDLGLGQIVWSPLAQGVLTGKYQPGELLRDGTRATDPRGGSANIRGYLRNDVLARVRLLRPLARELDLSLAQLALAWVLQNRDVSAAIIGASSPAQLTANATASGVELAAEVMATMNTILAPVVTTDPRLTARSSPPRRA